MKDLKVWESHEVLEETMRRDTPSVASALHLGPSLVGKWKEAPVTEKDFTQSGARNPLDRLKIIISTIEHKDPDRAYLPIRWLNVQFGFLPPIKAPKITATDDIQKALLEWTTEFGESCKSVSSALADGRVTRAEVKKLYAEILDDYEAGMGLFMLLREMVD